ncbi:MAG: GNAT family N-acetyltransferase [Thermanaerothrix sp.]|nr:GNAT family N-acetyltransferase [Thermanaerothrix sp.]
MSAGLPSNRFLPPLGDVLFSMLKDSAVEAGELLMLLRSRDLTDRGLEGHLEHMIAALRGGRLIGAVGAVPFSSWGMIRSLCVLPDFEGLGIGGELLGLAEERLREQGASSAWLMTSGAEGYFILRGYERALQVPSHVAHAMEVLGCPSCAATMFKDLSL